MDVVSGTAGMLAGVCVGVGATLVMDASLVLAGRLAPEVLASEKLDVNLIGRWVAGLGRGPRQGEDITMAPVGQREARCEPDRPVGRRTRARPPPG
jgi:hypothetical protein